MANMSKYIVEITPYQVINSSGPLPLSDALQETGEPYLFSYEGEVGHSLQRIDDPDRVKRRGHLYHSCAGVFISNCLPSSLEESVIFISPGHPKELCCNREADEYWRTLAFEDDIGTGCLTLDHLGPDSHLIYNFHAANVSSWAKLFVKTAHLSHPTDAAKKNPVALSGSPEVLWGLVALNVGNDIGNLGDYVTFGDRGIKLVWSLGSQPDRTPARALAVRVYHNGPGCGPIYLV